MLDGKAPEKVTALLSQLRCELPTIRSYFQEHQAAQETEDQIISAVLLSSNDVQCCAAELASLSLHPYPISLTVLKRVIKNVLPHFRSLIRCVLSL